MLRYTNKMLYVWVEYIILNIIHIFLYRCFNTLLRLASDYEHKNFTSVFLGFTNSYCVFPESMRNAHQQYGRDPVGALMSYKNT